MFAALGPLHCQATLLQRVRLLQRKTPVPRSIPLQWKSRMRKVNKSATSNTRAMAKKNTRAGGKKGAKVNTTSSKGGAAGKKTKKTTTKKTTKAAAGKKVAKAPARGRR
jgi:hypothetical protein